MPKATPQAATSNYTASSPNPQQQASRSNPTNRSQPHIQGPKHFNQPRPEHNQPQPQAQPSSEQPNPKTAQTNNNQDNTQTKDYQLPQYKREESPIAPGLYKPMPEETVFTWEAATRPFKKRNRQFFTTIIIIALLVALILFFAGQFLPVAVVFAVTFLVYVSSVVPPEKITYKITTYGIRLEKNLYYWEELGRFWFEKKFDQDVLYIETVRFPGRVTLVIEPDKKTSIKEILAEVLIEEKPEPTPYEKVSNWLQKKIPLDFD